MSACTAANRRRILHNITNMEDPEENIVVDGTHEKTQLLTTPTAAAATTTTTTTMSSSSSSSWPSETRPKLEAAISAMPAAAAAAAAAPTEAADQVSVSRSTGKNNERNTRFNGKNCLKPFRIKAKFDCGSGSGDQDGGQDGIDIAAKKRKTRRGKPKHRKLKPYSKLYRQQSRYRSARLAKTGRQPPAPYNTTQFLMDDHNSDLPDLEQKLSEATSIDVPTTFQKPPAPTRTRDSSFSVDSDEDYFYSSPEDEEEFLTKEFSSAYEDLHAERLGSLSKSELIQEYVQLEAKVDLLTKRLRSRNFHQTEEREVESKTGTNVDTETMKKLKIYQQRIDDLMQQNEQLRRENEALRTERHDSPASSIDSESDSDSTSNGNHSPCSCPLRSPTSSPEHTGYKRCENAHKKSSSICSSDSKSDSSASSTSTTPDEFIMSNNVTNGRTTNQEMDEGLPT